jgi:hypothetical protein
MQIGWSKAVRPIGPEPRIEENAKGIGGGVLALHLHLHQFQVGSVSS